MARQTPSTQTAAKPSLGDVVAALVFSVSMGAAWLYMAGWTYAYHYFDRFYVGLLTLDIPRETFFIYGFWVVRSYALWVGLLLLLGLVAIILRPRLPFVPPRGLMSWLGLVIFGLIFWLGYQAAVSTAQSHFVADRIGGYPASKRVKVWVDPGWLKDEGTSKIEKSLAEGCYRFLLQNNDNLFLFRPFQDAPATTLPVMIIPWSEVKTVRVLPDAQSCG